MDGKAAFAPAAPVLILLGGRAAQRGSGDTVNVDPAGVGTAQTAPPLRPQELGQAGNAC